MARFPCVDPEILAHQRAIHASQQKHPRSNRFGLLAVEFPNIPPCSVDMWLIDFESSMAHWFWIFYGSLIFNLLWLIYFESSIAHLFWRFYGSLMLNILYNFLRSKHLLSILYTFLVVAIVRFQFQLRQCSAGTGSCGRRTSRASADTLWEWLLHSY